jgi:hypothetical protein
MEEMNERQVLMRAIGSLNGQKASDSGKITYIDRGVGEWAGRMVSSLKA